MGKINCNKALRERVSYKLKINKSILGFINIKGKIGLNV